MAKQDSSESLASPEDCWAYLAATKGALTGYAKKDVKFLVMLAHQAFADAEALRQARRLEDPVKSALRSQSLSGGVASDLTGIEGIDRLSRAASPVHQVYDHLMRQAVPVLEGLRRLGIRGRRRDRLSHPHVLAAAFVQMGIEARGLRAIEPLEMEAVVRICEDRDATFPAALDAQTGAKKYASWRRLLWKGKKIIPLIIEVSMHET